jgi:hypothetical protein
MRALAVCTALFLSGCGTYSTVVGPSRTSITGGDVAAIKQLSRKFLARYGGSGASNSLTLNAVHSNKVYVYTVSQANSFYVDFVAIRRGGAWKIDWGAGSPEPPMDDGTFPQR